MESGEVKTNSKENDIDLKVTNVNGKVNKPEFEPAANTSPGKNVKKRSITTNLGDSQVPRRLSQLFNPPTADDIPLADEDANESSRLLVTPSLERRSSLPNQQPVGNRSPKSRSNEDNYTVIHLSVDKIESKKGEGELGTDNESRKSSHDSTESDDESENNYQDKEADYTSWDDTICSNRSAYFKHYYQKNLSSIGAGRQSEGATSHNSLVSLIKEKDKMSDKKSAEDHNKKKEDLGLMFLVIILFLVLVVGISLIYHYYQIHLEELSLFKRLKFQEDEKLLSLIDSKGHLDIQARLGTTLPVYSKPEDCTHYLQHFYNYKSPDDHLPKSQIIRANKSAVDFVVKRRRSQNEFQFDDETVCLDWSNQARVQIHRAPSVENVNCYNVFWSTQSIGMTLQDCILINRPEHGVWWGIGEITGGGFPLESITNLPSAPFKTGELGKHPWGRILRRTLLSSFGGLLILPDHLPASVSVNPDELCISVNASRDDLNPSVPLTLNYTICSSPNVSSTIDYLHYLARGGRLFPPLSKADKNTLRYRILQRIKYPVWLPYTKQDQEKLTQERVLEYAESIVQANQSESGHILLPLSWQKKTGDLKFDPTRFPDPKNLTDILHNYGFQLALTISPLVSTDTKAFSNGTTEGFWVQQKGSSLPALISHQEFLAGAYTDFTNPRASDWFASMLSEIKMDFGIDIFHLDPPDAHAIPRYHEFNRHISNPDLALQPFLKAVSQVNLPMSTEGILSPPPLPTFVSVSSADSGWNALASLIPRILTLSMLGFPLVDAGIVGGDIALSGHLVDEKLYIRWFQAVSFLPAFQMSFMPNRYDEETLTIIEDYRRKRKTLVIPRLERALEGTLVNNTPLIFPLGLLYPEDLEAAAVGDEWILGDNLLVAPILEKDKTSRDIYIPSGLWESQLDSRLKRGPGWIHDYKVPLSDVALFIRRYTM